MRFDYSVLGDGVNLASRIEGQSKIYGVPIIIGPDTEREAPDFATLELDLIRVRGKSQPERIYALAGDETVAAEAWFRQLKTEHEAFRNAYLARDWPAARAAIAACKRAGGARFAALYAFYETRIAAHEADPPPADWDGVFEGK
jgi:adenylate cyclase